MNTKRTRRKFTDQQKQDILGEADARKAAGGEYKEVLSNHNLTSSTLAKWRKEITDKKPHRNASKAPKRKIRSKLTLDDIRNELECLEKRREELLSMKVSDLL